MTQTMKAAVIDTYKQPQPRLTDVLRPEIRPNDVLVKVIAASINPIDLKTKDGGLKMLLTYDFPFIMGSDFAGIVEEVGPLVDNFRVGDAVYGRVQKDRIGTFAEYLAVDSHAIALKPTNTTFEEAASLPLVALTSYQALQDLIKLQPGQKVFISGGSGGIGTNAIQFAKSLGAQVATTTSAKNFDLVKSLGADVMIDYHKTDFTEVLADYDAVLDTRGGKTLEDSFKIVKPGGKIVSIAGLPNQQFGKEYGLPLWKQTVLRFVTRNLTKLTKQTGVSYQFLFMKPSGKQLEAITHLVEAGTIKPIIDRTYPFSKIDEALAYSETGRATGKIILQMNSESNNIE